MKDRVTNKSAKIIKIINKSCRIKKWCLKTWSTNACIQCELISTQEKLWWSKLEYKRTHRSVHFISFSGFNLLDFLNFRVNTFRTNLKNVKHLFLLPPGPPWRHQRVQEVLRLWGPAQQKVTTSYDFIRLHHFLRSFGSAKIIQTTAKTVSIHTRRNYCWWKHHLLVGGPLHEVPGVYPSSWSLPFSDPFGCMVLLRSFEKQITLLRVIPTLTDYFVIVSDISSGSIYMV